MREVDEVVRAERVVFEVMFDGPHVVVAEFVGEDGAPQFLLVDLRVGDAVEHPALHDLNQTDFH